MGTVELFKRDPLAIHTVRGDDKKIHVVPIEAGPAQGPKHTGEIYLKEPFELPGALVDPEKCRRWPSMSPRVARCDSDSHCAISTNPSRSDVVEKPEIPIPFVVVSSAFGGLVTHAHRLHEVCRPHVSRVGQHHHQGYEQPHAAHRRAWEYKTKLSPFSATATCHSEDGEISFVSPSL